MSPLELLVLNLVVLTTKKLLSIKQQQLPRGYTEKLVGGKLRRRLAATTSGIQQLHARLARALPVLRRQQELVGQALERGLVA